MNSNLLKMGALAGLFFAIPIAGSAAGTDADNSANNQTDRDSSAVTPEKQSNAESDVSVTRAIRRAFVKDSSLSIYAHNLRIITTTEHVVYLRGAVGSNDDVAKIVSLAQQNSNGYPIKNRISVSSK